MPKEGTRANGKDDADGRAEARGGGKTRTIKIGDVESVAPGEFKHITFKISESSTGRPIQTPILVKRGEHRRDGTMNKLRNHLCPPSNRVWGLGFGEFVKRDNTK